MKIRQLVGKLAGLVIAAGTIQAGSISTLPIFENAPGTFSSTAAMFGQAFVATADDSVLTSFTLEVRNDLGGPVGYGAYVFLANVVSLANALVLQNQALFTSVSTIPTSSPSDAFQAVTVSTGNLSLQAGETYFVFIDAGQLSLDDSEKLAFGFVGDANTPRPYPDGMAYYGTGNFFPNNPSLSAFFGFNEDAAFDLEFAGGSTTAAPEPNGSLLAAAGLACFGRAAIRRFTSTPGSEGNFGTSPGRGVQNSIRIFASFD